jgi:DNA-binding PadR family transcriptional regulator
MSFKLSPEYALLGVLMTGPKHGYEMHSYFLSKMGQFWRLSMSQVYSLLKRMEKNGMLISKEEWQVNRPAKKTFFITQAGKESLLNWIHSPVKHVRDLRIEFMAKLFLIKELKLEGATDIIDKQVEVLQENLRLIKVSKENIIDEFQKALHSFKMAQANSAIDWLKECKTFFS